MKHSLDRFKSLSLFVKEHFNSLVYVKMLKLVVKKACHCNKIFLRKTKLILALNHFIPRCAYYNPYFAFRRTGTHPPFVNS